MGKVRTVRVRCRGCGEVGEIEVGEHEVPPYIFYCPYCDDFMLADPVK